jgi:hypothetical protein
MSRASWGDVFSAVFLLALIMLLVRPSSLAPQLLQALGNGATAIVRYAVEG